VSGGCGVGQPNTLIEAAMIDILLHIIETKTRLAAVEAFGTPPRSRQARRWRTIALALFTAASALMLAAAFTFEVGRPNVVSETLGWSGIACIQLCVVCGLRYAAANRGMENCSAIADQE
jgi:hypothetical protein